MIRANKKELLPYIGIPVIVAALAVLRAGSLDLFILFRYLLVAIFGYVASVLDLRAKKIPNTLILAMLGVWVVAMVPKLFIDTDAAITMLLDSVFGFLVGGVPFMAVYLISRKGIGGGDVKFMASAGLYVGFMGALATVVYGTILAGLTALVLLLLKKLGRKDSMPLAPFLYAGILITVFTG